MLVHSGSHTNISYSSKAVINVVNAKCSKPLQYLPCGFPSTSPKHTSRRIAPRHESVCSYCVMHWCHILPGSHCSQGKPWAHSDHDKLLAENERVTVAKLCTATAPVRHPVRGHLHTKLILLE